MKVVSVAGGIRKSPSKVEKARDSVSVQKAAITAFCDSRFGLGGYSIEWFVDVDSKGDDPDRPALLEFFDRVQEFEYMVFHLVDRYSRSWLGLKWLMEYFVTNQGRSPHKGCKLMFVEGMSELYQDDNKMNLWVFVQFATMMMYAMFELLNIRTRTQRGRDKLSPEEWALKYCGRPKGSKNKKKKR